MTQVHNRSNHTEEGFTIIEVTLSMAFIAFLLLGIALLTLQISAIYNKGLTIRAVNQAGQLVTTDMQRTLNVSDSLNVKFVEGGGATPTGGRLCTDSAIYAWNYGKYLTASSRFNKYQNGSTKPIRLIKFPFDGSTDYCALNASGSYPSLPDTSSDLLTGGDGDVALHGFTINRDSTNAIGQAVYGDTTGTQRLYELSLIIGTSEQGILNSNVNGCEVPVSGVDDQYCAVNQFTFTARAGNG